MRAQDPERRVEEKGLRRGHPPWGVISRFLSLCLSLCLSRGLGDVYKRQAQNPERRVEEKGLRRGHPSRWLIPHFLSQGSPYALVKLSLIHI